jgi:hypothetical protein
MHSTCYLPAMAGDVMHINWDGLAWEAAHSFDDKQLCNIYRWAWLSKEDRAEIIAILRAPLEIHTVQSNV